MFTPGDNDWVDCDRTANGGYNSLERLDHERQLFFNTPFSLGQHRMRVDVQSKPTLPRCERADAVRREPALDGRRRHLRHAQRPGLVQQPLRHSARPGRVRGAQRRRHRVAATTRSRRAKARHSAAVMLISQADPGWDASDGDAGAAARSEDARRDRRQPDGFQEFLSALRDDTVALRRSRSPTSTATRTTSGSTSRSRTPLGQRLENFTRVETFGDHQENGDNDVHWLKVVVDPSSREVFSFQPQIVPANRTAVPAP